MTEHIYGTLGGLTFPVPASAVSTTELSLTVLDPSRALLLALFRAALKAELDAVWTVACAALPSDHPLKNSTSVVADTLELKPSKQVMLERKAGWPLLCLHREGEATYEPGFYGQTRKHKWFLHLFLGPRVGIAEDRKLLDVFLAASNVVAMVIERRGHPNYQSGALQFFGSSLDADHPLGSVRMLTHDVGQAPFATDDEPYHQLLIGIETEESSSDTLGAFPTAQGMSTHVAGGNATEVVPELVGGDTDYPGTMYANG